jgi:predicted nucleic acid-binding protein
MALLVIDASSLVDLLLHNDSFEAIKREVAGKRLAAPHLIDAEVGQVVRRLLQTGIISLGEAEECLTDLGRMRLQRYPHTHLLPAAFAWHENMTIYDALYLTLAEYLGCPLLTRDSVFSSVKSDVQVIRV